MGMKMTPPSGARDLLGITTLAPRPHHRSAQVCQAMPVARRLLDAVSLLIAAALWLPAVHLFFMPERAPLARGELSATGEALLARQLPLWEDPVLGGGHEKLSYRHRFGWFCLRLSQSRTGRL